jgi:hypothetical protein
MKFTIIVDKLRYLPNPFLLYSGSRPDEVRFVGAQGLAPLNWFKIVVLTRLRNAIIPASIKLKIQNHIGLIFDF